MLPSSPPDAPAPSTTAVPAGSPSHAGSSHGQGSAPHYAPEQDVHLLDRLAVIYRYRRICAATFVLVSAALIIQGYSTVQMYQAQARLLIEDERSTAVPGLQNDANQYYEDPEPYYQTQYKILKGRDLTRRVVKKLHLEDVPEFNGKAAAAPTPLTVVRDLRTRLFGSANANGPAGGEAPKPDETSDESAFVSAFVSRVSVDPVRGSRLVDVTFQAEDPKFATLAINTLIDEYVDQNLAFKRQTTENMLEWLGKELQTQQQKVEDSERGLAEYRDKENALSLDDKQNIVLARLN